MNRLKTATDHRALARRLGADWQSLCDTYLPVASANSIWRFSREAEPADPEQGWKLHIGATILNAGELLKRVAPLLRERNALYKTTSTLTELGKLNAGIFYGHSQVGKFLTIYPQTTEEAVWLAGNLNHLTSQFKAPSIPYDSKYRPGSCVHYRYGAFKTLEVTSNGGQSAFAIRDPIGNLVADTRDSSEPPVWVVDPFLTTGRCKTTVEKTPLHSTYKAFHALAQRGKGGVYQAVDLSVAPPRLCILKEGRKDGEVEWDGRDGFWRIRHEERILTKLRQAGVNVPCCYSSFKAERNYFLVTEFVHGDTLEDWLSRKKQRLPISLALKLSIAIASQLAQIHAAGWVWRDCKPRNIIRTKSGELRLLDFEGACLIDQPDPLPWGTPPFLPPEAIGCHNGSRLPEDLYALGVTIYLLLAGGSPRVPSLSSLEKSRRNIPREVCRVVAALLDPDPQRRPSATAVAQSLKPS